MNSVALPAIVGLSSGLLLFLLASGLTLTFGVMGIVNFAHGGFFMIGAYTAFELTSGDGGLGVAQFAMGVVAAAVVTAAIGLVLERLVFARLYATSPIYTLLATYALLLMAQGAVVMKWGRLPQSAPLPDGLSGSVDLGSLSVPVYNLVCIAVAAVVAVGLFAVVYRTRLGLEARAIAMDRSMASALGIRFRLVYAVLFTLGVFLAGLAGAMQAPLTQLTPSLAHAYVVMGFAIVVIGGLGSVTGTLVASLVVGVTNAFAVSFAPDISGYAVYAVLVVVLVVWPGGLLSRGAPVVDLH